MFRDFRPVWAEINLDNLVYNIKQIREKAKSKELIGVVKADAYGHGAVEVAPILLQNGATRLAVAVLAEGVELRKSGIKCPIMILGLTPETLSDDLIKYDIEPAVSSYEYALTLSNIAQSEGKTIKIHIAIDTGMGRIGFLPSEESIEEIYKISKLANIEIEGLFSHFCTADEADKSYSNMQFDKYNWFYEKLISKGIKINMRDMANSAAIMELPETHYDGTRPGIILYGYYPSNEVDKNQLSIKPVMTWKANIVHVKTLDKGEYIGYGRKFRTERKSIIATLPIGYADGYTRMMSGKAKVIINGKFAPVVGNICMDQCMIDVTDVGDVKPGDEVILMGSDGNLKFNADDMAAILGTINYEVICMVSKRVPRVYIENGQIIKIKNYV
ncbi:alanine racemase [Clostridium aciditolerans]|uniref:Alanine racemase n=1 Tax=Clostridium aciditolerans TaxID=339861 RepID=A0A934HRP6_9CLOT|nr:alanine racemase [Clostridium aciditolerans]MBI6873246.1 alanine racemase [Clostridium aciditolerans]